MQRQYRPTQQVIDDQLQREDGVADLWYTNFFDYHMYDMVQQYDTSRVAKLFIGYNQLTEEGIYYFSCANWDGLIFINLWNNKIGSKGCYYFSQTSLPNLAELNLSKNEICSAGMLHLSKNEFQSLDKLDLSDNHIRRDGVRSLVRLPKRNLSSLAIQNNKMRRLDLLGLIYIVPSNSFESIYLSTNHQQLARNLIEQWQDKELRIMLYKKFGPKISI